MQRSGLFNCHVKPALAAARLALTAIAASAVMLWAAAALSQMSADKLMAPLQAEAGLKKAAAYFDAGRFAEAAPLFEAFIAANPYYANMGMVRYALGYSYLKTGRAEGAEKQLALAAKAMPNRPEALLARAQAQIMLKEYDPAAASIESYLKKVPKDAEALSTLCQLYVQMENYTAAEGCLARAVALKPKSFEAWYQYGVLLMKNGKTDAARTALSKAGKLNPKMSGADMYIGMAAYQSGDMRAAREAFERIYAAGKADAKILAALGSIYARSDNYKKAEFYFQKALAKSPSDITYLSNLVLCKVNQKKNAEAVALLEKSVKKFKNDPKILSMLVSLYIETEKYDKARELLESLVKKYPKNAEYMKILATLYGNGFDSDKTAAAWRKYLALSPKDTAARKSLADALKKADKKEDALAEYERIIKLEPKNQEAPREAGLLCEELGKTEKAVAIYKNMNSLFPQLAFPLARLGEIAYKAGDTAGAETYLSAAAGKIITAEAYVYSYMAEIRYSQGKTVEAELLFRKAIEQMLEHSQQVFMNFMQQTKGSLDLMKLIEISEKEKGLEANLDQALAGVGKCFSARDAKVEELDYLSGLIEKYSANKKLSLFAARLAKEIDDPDRAILLCEKILKNDVKDGDAHKLMGWAYTEKGNAEEAGKAFMRAVEVSTSDDGAWTSLIDNYIARGRVSDLEAYARKKLGNDSSGDTLDKVFGLINSRRQQ